MCHLVCDIQGSCYFLFSMFPEVTQTKDHNIPDVLIYLSFGFSVVWKLCNDQVYFHDLRDQLSRLV